MIFDRKKLDLLLKLAGSSYAEFDKEIKRQGGHLYLNSDFLTSSFIWNNSSKGYTYWRQVSESVDFLLSPNMSNKVFQKRLFKFLADELGYEIEG